MLSGTFLGIVARQRCHTCSVYTGSFKYLHFRVSEPTDAELLTVEGHPVSAFLVAIKHGTTGISGVLGTIPQVQVLFEEELA